MVAGASRSWFEHCRPTSSGGPATAHPFNATLDRTRGSGRTPLSLSWLTPTERAVVNERAEVISELQWERRVRKPRAEMRVGDIHVGPDRIGSDQYILTLSGAPAYGVPAYRWPYFPTRLEIVTAAREKREQLKEAREQQQRWREEQTQRQAKIQACAPDPDAPDTLGWRGWRFDGEVLISPTRGTRW